MPGVPAAPSAQEASSCAVHHSQARLMVRARYNASAKGRARKARHNASAKGRAQRARYRASAKGGQRQVVNNQRRVYVGDRYLGRAPTVDRAALINWYIKDRLDVFKQRQSAGT